MERKIYDDMGFLTKEGKSFVDDGFTKEVQRVLATATSANDALIIGGILKSLIGHHTTNKFLEMRLEQEEQVQTQIVEKVEGKINKTTVSGGQAIANALSLLKG